MIMIIKFIWAQTGCFNSSRASVNPATGVVLRAWPGKKSWRAMIELDIL